MFLLWAKTMRENQTTIESWRHISYEKAVSVVWQATIGRTAFLPSSVLWVLLRSPVMQ